MHVTIETNYTDLHGNKYLLPGATIECGNHGNKQFLLLGETIELSYHGNKGIIE